MGSIFIITSETEMDKMTEEDRKRILESPPVGTFALMSVVNGDSLLDLVIGNINGTLSYYWNFGSRQVPLFNKDSVVRNFGHVNVTPYGNVSGFSQPFIFKDKIGAVKLLVGSQSGTVYDYNIEPALVRDTGTIFALLDSNYLHESVGQNSTISVADINGDGDLEYLMGTATGGIMMYSDSIWDPSILLAVQDLPSSKGQLFIYPNPTKDYFICAFENTEFINPKTEVYDLLGQQISVLAAVNDGKVIINCPNLISGFYLVRITDSGKTYTGRILLCR